jgi:hypothetical protein
MREALTSIMAFTESLALMLAMKVPVPPAELLPEVQRINRIGRAALPTSGEPSTAAEPMADDDARWLRDYGITFAELSERIKDIHEGRGIPHSDVMQRLRADLAAR